MERMYRDHDYTVAEISNRLGIPELTVAHILGIKHYQVQTPLHKNEDTEQMIFPDRLRNTRFAQAQLNKAPLRKNEELCLNKELTADDWFEQQGFTVGPAAGSSQNPKESIDWWSRDAGEFYLLCTCMIAWCVYWLGVHRGAW